MDVGKNNETVDERFSLSEYLESDTPEILEIKSLEYIEPEYCEYLGAIEYSIAQHCYENDRKIEDKDVALALKTIMLNYELDISFFIKDIEIQIISVEYPASLLRGWKTSLVTVRNDENITYKFHFGN